MALTEGTVDSSALIVGDWSEISIEYPAQSGTWLYVGNCPEGVCEVSKEDYQHEGTNFPRKVDLVVPIRTGMKFTGRIEEIHVENLRLVLGMDPTNVNNYVYVGALTTPTYFTFRAQRQRNSDAQEITFKMFKAQSSGLMQIAGGDEAISTPIEIIALDDAAGNYGGSDAAPLGYIYLPAKA